MATQTNPDKGASAAPKQETKGKGRAKKADAAYSMVFLNDKGEESNRIPSPVTAVRVRSSDNKAKTVQLKDIPPAVLAQLAADGMRSRLNKFLSGVTKADVGKVHALTDEFVKVAKNATLYIPKEGGGPGRAFNFDFWLDVLARTADIRVKAGNTKARLMTPALRDEARAKLEAMTPEERKQKQKDWEQDKVFRNAAAQIRAEREAAKAKIDNKDLDSGYDASADLF